MDPGVTKSWPSECASLPSLSRWYPDFHASFSGYRVSQAILATPPSKLADNVLFISTLSRQFHLTVLEAAGAQISMIEIPPDVVAGWPAPNYANPETKGPALPTIVILFYALAAVALAVRLYDKVRISRRFFVEDYLIIVTMVSPT